MTLTIPDLLIEADPAREKLKVTLLEFNMINEFLQISTSQRSNSFELRNLMTNVSTTHTIPDGTYSLHELARAITATTDNLLLCTYAPIQNKMVFRLAAGTVAAHTITFSPGLAAIVGMLQDASYPLTDQSNLVSANPCRPLATGTLFIKLADHTPEGGSLVLSNLNDEEGILKLDNTLAVVPISNTPPWHYMTWTNNSPDSGGLFAGDTKLATMQIQITDEECRPITDLPEWFACLRVDVVRVTQSREELDTLQRILQTLKDQLMLSYLGRSAA